MQNGKLRMLECDVRVSTGYIEGARDGPATALPSTPCPFCLLSKAGCGHLQGRKTCWTQRSMAGESDGFRSPKSHPCLTFSFSFFPPLDSAFQVPACPYQGRWADRFRGMCGDHLWSEDVLELCSMTLRFIDSENISVRSHIEHLLV